MFGYQRLAIVGVVVVVGLIAFPSGIVHRWVYSIDQTDSSFESARKRVVLTGPFANIREEERSRRAERPPGDPKREGGLNYAGVFEGRKHDGSYPVPRPAEPMPPTACRSVEPAPKHASPVAGPHRVHH